MKIVATSTRISLRLAALKHVFTFVLSTLCKCAERLRVKLPHIFHFWSFKFAFSDLDSRT